MKKRIWFFVKINHSGNTMAEVIVAFMILVIIMGIFSQTMRLSENVMEQSEKTLKAVHNLVGSYYLEGEADPDGDKARAIAPVITRDTAVFRSDTGEEFFSVKVEVREIRGDGGVIKDVH